MAAQLPVYIDSNGDYCQILSTDVISTAALGTGAASSTTALFGNNTWSNNVYTLGSTSISFGSTITTIAGLVSVTSTAFYGALTGTATTATNVAGGAAGSIPYQTASGTTAYIAGSSTNNWVLTYNTGTNTPYWAAASGGGGTSTLSAITAVSTNATFYPTFVSATTGNLAIDVNSNLSYNPSTGILTTSGYNTGTLGFSDTGILYSGQSNTNGYIQAILQNTNSGTVASSDFIVSNNLGTGTTYYGDFGINSSGFSGSNSFSLPNATYLTSTSGDLAIGTTTSNAIHFVINGGATDAYGIGTSGEWIIAGSAGTSGYVHVSGGTGAPSAWTNPSTFSNKTTYGASPPSSPNIGDSWIDSSSGNEYTWVNAGSSNEWVQMVASTSALIKNSGSVAINFGTGRGSPYGSVVITGQTNITSSSQIWVQVAPQTTDNNYKLNHVLACFCPTWSTLVPGVGFTIEVVNALGLNLTGSYTFNWFWF